MSTFKINKRLILFVLSLLLISFGEASFLVYAQHPATKVITIKGDNDFPPFSFINSNGEPDGFDIDLIKAIMNELQLPYNLSMGDWETVLKEFKEGKIDLIPGKLYKKESNDIFYLSDYTTVISRSIVYRIGAEINQLSDLNNRSIVVLPNSNVYEFFLKAVDSCKLIESESFSEEIKELSRGKYDVVVTNRFLADYVIEANNIDNLIIKDVEVPSIAYTMVANDRLLINKVNEALYRLHRNGEYDRIFDKWFMQRVERSTPMYYYILLIIIVIIVIILYSFITILRRQVKKKSELIQLKNMHLSLAMSAGRIIVLGYDVNKNKLYNIQGTYFKLGGITLKEGYELIHSNDREQFIRFFSNILKGDWTEENTIKVRLKMANNQWLYHQIECAKVKKEKANNTIIIAIRDINTEVEEQNKIKEISRNLSLTMEAGGITGWIYDIQSKSFTQILTDRLDDISITKSTLGEMTFEEDIERFNESIDKIVTRKSDKISQIFRLQMDSELRYYECIMAPKYQDATDITQITIVIKNITKSVRESAELKEYRLKTELSIKSSDIMQWDYDVATHQVTVTNELGVEDGSIIPKEFYSDTQSLIKFFDELDLGEDRTFSFDTYIKLGKNESLHFVRISCIPLEKDMTTGKVLRYTGFRKDNTDFKLAQKHLESEKKNAEEADQLKSAFLANMSHEIRTPLNAIVGFSELLQEEEDKVTKAEYIDIINTNSDLLLRLINDILDLSKIEAGTIDLKIETFDFTKFFNDFVRGLELRARNKGLEFIIDSPYKSCSVIFDRNRVGQIITNYATNSIKYTPEGSVTIGYKYKNEGLYIYVKDTGIGIDYEKQSRVFQRFEKLDSFAQGTGLGLSICKAIAEGQGGNVGFKSEPGVGSLFWAWIPCEISVEK
ncbi:MAG: transporter substrate-binding domain-containing protein [Muribaculaceae bacterium]|nr:transporter substrate-binding domain-containing protein [Muribaculaceae bacterium]